MNRFSAYYAGAQINMLITHVVQTTEDIVLRETLFIYFVEVVVGG